MYSSRCIERILTGVGIARVGGDVLGALGTDVGGDALGTDVGGDVLGTGVVRTIVGGFVACSLRGELAAE
jgi:hypothetical protein